MDVLTPRPLGPTGLKVTPLCVGSGELGDMTSVHGYAVPEEQALATVRAFAGPFTFVDTSNYGAGTSERRIGAVARWR
ncbi:hypothetical protein [Pseudonocardia sp.]|uniref:hypothetical protein n=1 Tax=Pseudonocardia sp. TaxID=60912 RepID=UPI0031FDDCA4